MCDIHKGRWIYFFKLVLSQFFRIRTRCRSVANLQIIQANFVGNMVSFITFAIHLASKLYTIYDHNYYALEYNKWSCLSAIRHIVRYIELYLLLYLSNIKYQRNLISNCIKIPHEVILNYIIYNKNLLITFQSMYLWILFIYICLLSLRTKKIPTR